MKERPRCGPLFRRFRRGAKEKHEMEIKWKACFQHVLWIVILGLAQGFKQNDIFNIANLSQIKEGTELSLLEDYVQGSYKLEDFFWTGSGDGSISVEEEHTTTIYTTQTIYVTPTIYINQTNTTVTPKDNAVEDYEEDLEADRQFWLLTVLKSDGKDPDLVELRKSLANLYKKAFLRQQAAHLGIRQKRQSKDKSVHVYLHKVDKSPINGEDKIEVVYHVAVAGQPVDAVIASQDMKLVSDEEVKKELGFPFLVKSEPYIKPTAAQEILATKPAWLFISISLVALSIILLIIVALGCFITKNKKSDGNITNRQRIFDVHDGRDNGRLNEGFLGDNLRSAHRHPSPTYINFKDASNEDHYRPSTPQSASSRSSIDISPLMSLGKHQKVPRPKAAVAVNKTVPVNKSPPPSSSSSNISDNFYIKDGGVISPKSYLSMPSVKSFPKGNNPEPLNKVLEPVSVVHLDMMHDDDHDKSGNYERDFKMLRHGSLNDAEDPGVIGPVVWNLHKHRLEQNTNLMDQSMDDLRSSNASRMRKRFHDLLDDTFSLFGSRRESPHESVQDLSRKPIEVKSHSAIERNQPKEISQRPKTSEPRRISEGPKGAWTSKAPSPLVRPISAPYRPSTVPKINRELILSDGILKQNDPAIPLIEEIKKEIDKCSLPGSTKQ